MHRGLLLHYAGRYEESNQVLQRAEAIIDDRYTKSVSLALLSIVTSDRALAWLPSPTERLMVNYYGALNYLALGDPDEAAVEVRRLSRLLELEEDDEFEAEEAAMREVLRYFAGSVFEATGNRNDAAVSYRHVWGPGDDLSGEALRPRFIDLYDEDLPDWEPSERKQDFDAALDSIMAARADSSAPLAPDGLEMFAQERAREDVPPDSLEVSRPPEDLVADAPPASPDSLIGPPLPPVTEGGDVVVLLEQGFVAHRVERSLNVPVFPVEADGLHSSDADVRFATASCVASRAFQGRYDFSEILSESGTDWRGASGGKCVVSGARNGDSNDSGRDLYLMRVAWPEMVSSGLPTDVSVKELAIAADAGPLQLAALDSLPEPTPAPNDLDPAILSARAEKMGEAGADGAEALIGPPLPMRRPGMRGSVSGAVTEEFEDRLGGILIKAVARTALKYELARGIEKEVDKKNELLGEIAFLTANAAAALFERADTRSWHLLPDEMSIVRLRLPAGAHPLTLQVQTARGGTRLVDLGEVIVRDGSVHVLSARVWP
jgi:hypothetical protein